MTPFNTTAASYVLARVVELPWTALSQPIEIVLARHLPHMFTGLEPRERESRNLGVATR